MEQPPGRKMLSKYIPQLDGIRGIAILLVVTFHYFPFIKLFSFGWSGVDLFFVLSGYLITSRLYELKQRKNYFSTFYTNRALRILPIYYLTLIFFYAGFNLFLRSENLYAFTFYNRNWGSFLLFFENWTFINELPIAKHLQHFWSLAVEEQFYLIWPLFLFIFLEKKYLFKIIIFLLVAIIIVRCVIFLRYPLLQDCRHFFYNTFCRMDSFIIGGCLFLIRLKNDLKRVKYFILIPLAILVIGIFFTNASQSNSFISTTGYTILAVFFAGLINFSITYPGSSLSKFLKTKLLIFTGKISYGLYIYHWLVLLVLQPKLMLWLKNFFLKDEQLGYWLALLLSLVVSLVISIISYFFFEAYFLKLKQ